MISKDINKRFISFEGIDFSGKSTQIKLLKSYLEKEGQSVFILREPGGTDISERIRAILLDKEHIKMNARAEMLLFSAARVQLTEEKIIPLLKKGSFVIADRFVDSTSAYQGYGRELEQETIDHVNQFATFGILPGITFYLKISPQDAFQRRIDSGQEADRLESAGLEFYNKVYEGYENIAKNDPDRFSVLDATQVKDEIHRQIKERINTL
ncbi:MAG: dTMP kinase [Calditrichaeota bacterium]|nr:MAG: dTMP kinase [Calditrichota bacterium]MBL1208083.1 dTMP kinase [Calditrichota bacterium]NOG47921.1 dTMP kinase [Calditrichota bacterium]